MPYQVQDMLIRGVATLYWERHDSEQMCSSSSRRVRGPKHKSKGHHHTTSPQLSHLGQKVQHQEGVQDDGPLPDDAVRQSALVHEPRPHGEQARARVGEHLQYLDSME